MYILCIYVYIYIYYVYIYIMYIYIYYVYIYIIYAYYLHIHFCRRSKLHIATDRSSASRAKIAAASGQKQHGEAALSGYTLLSVQDGAPKMLTVMRLVSTRWCPPVMFVGL